jgi:hypothetical protein
MTTYWACPTGKPFFFGSYMAVKLLMKQMVPLKSDTKV